MKRIIVDNVSKKFRLGFKKREGALYRILRSISGKSNEKIFWALKGVSFEVRKGEIVGIIGGNGCGKTTLLKILSNIYCLSKGGIKIKGNVILAGIESGFNGRLTMKENIFLICSLLGLTKKEIKKRFESIVEFAGLKDFVNTKLYQFSAGMSERLSFSMAIHVNPDVLLLDEVFAVGDEDFRRKSAEKIKELAKNGVSVLFVSHELWMVEKYCDRVIWMSNGEIIKEGKPREIIKEYKKNV